MIAALLLALGGFLLLALSMQRHRRDLDIRWTVPRARPVGFLFLAGSLMPPLMSGALGIALVTWTMLLSVAASLVVGLICTCTIRK